MLTIAFHTAMTVQCRSVRRNVTGAVLVLHPWCHVPHSLALLAVSTEVYKAEALLLQISQEWLTLISERFFPPYLKDQKPKAVLFSSLPTFKFFRPFSECSFPL